MSGNISDYLEDVLLDHCLGTTIYTMASTVYCALFESSPGDDDSGTECSGTDYARKVATFTDASGGSCSNTTNITFTEAGGAWGTITHIGLYDHISTGNLLWWGTLDASKDVDKGDTFKINKNDLDLALT